MVKVNSLILDTIRRFIMKLDEDGILVEAIYLFGSYAKGNVHKSSDIDLAVISPDFTNDRFEERIRLMKLSSNIDPRLEPVPFTPETFVDEDPLAWEIKKEGIPVKNL
ncbi:MAG: nucleotidyltransferase domain-containing protein [Candidatus Scalindua sp. AMX11]|nr:MAG: nucleotidyltransferase domain-containing protein [Candidatus Scalindua sp.]NOG83321.1 nucleotidyltransferase domain-containing protein [Planctomycetota bacterium]RZV76779.1 MAG: nucleotidyltransferase domain-containing protein [Candidatus Scalindua sp. SCAELEC01]TDE63466.1 MAG: nucleotidyltransferase domain-containing protein [Candidatus Scalindua sp. AMX11]GJQ57462.1 MAG: nucleotidyltransferase [Candidatus Scalindua sp.]